MSRNAKILFAAGAIFLAALVIFRLFGLHVLPSLLAAWIFVLSAPAGALPILPALEIAGHGNGPHAIALRRILVMLPIGLLLTLPILFGVHLLYGWSHAPLADGWLNPLFFDARCVIYLAVWALLAFLLATPPAGRPRFALCIFAVLAYAITATLAADDWIGSAEPGADLSSLGLIFMASQAVIAAAIARFLGAPPSPLMALLGLFWGFVDFTRFLTVWSADKPHEILYYLHRWTILGRGVSWFSFLMVVFSLMTLIPGPLKKLTILASALVLVAHGFDTLWMVTPAVRGPFTFTAPDIVAMLGAAAIAAGLVVLRPGLRRSGPGRPA